MSPRKATAPPRFLDGCSQWQEYVTERDQLAERLADADAIADSAANEYQAAVVAHAAAIAACAAGEGGSPGYGPVDDPTPRRVAAAARRGLQAHQERRSEVLANLADDVEQAARDWWANQSEGAAARLAALADDMSNLETALQQVREVRRALDHEYYEQHGVQAPGGSQSDRTAHIGSVDALRAAVTSDPFELGPPIVRQGRVSQDGLGLQRFVAPGPSSHEPRKAAPSGNPGRDWL